MGLIDIQRIGILENKEQLRQFQSSNHEVENGNFGIHMGDLISI